MSTRLFFLLVALLPTQLTYYWFLPFSYVYGLPIDYLALQISLTDGVIFLLLICQLRPLFLWINRHPKGFLCFVALLMLFVLSSSSRLVSVLYAAKILELSFVGWYTLKNKKRITPWIGKALLVPLFVSAVLAVTQFSLGKSVGWLFYYLGERTFAYSTPGIAHIALWGNHLRPYATFPHPNVLAAFAVFVVLVNFQYSTRRVWYISHVIAFPVLFLTFSKGAIIGLTAAMISMYLQKVSARFVIGVLLLVSLLSPIAVVPTLLHYSFPSSIQERLILMAYSGQMISTHPYLGVGLQGFIPALPQAKAQASWVFPFSWWLQPVHNIYLLTVSQMGLLGTAIVLASIMRIKKKASPLLVFFLVAGLFDHYFLTLQQGQLMTAVIIALSLF